jgi:hypothetical protein
MLANQSCAVYLYGVLFNDWNGSSLGWFEFGLSLTAMEEATMPRQKQASKRKRATKAVPALGAAGLTLSLAGGASAAVAPGQTLPQTPSLAPSHLTLGEEEISDVSLATFYVFDKESTGSLRGLVQEARGCRCGGCRGCRGCRCGVGCGGCCLSWGACRIC